jgi:hypothetical protein
MIFGKKPIQCYTIEALNSMFTGLEGQDDSLDVASWAHILRRGCGSGQDVFE